MMGLNKCEKRNKSVVERRKNGTNFLLEFISKVQISKQLAQQQETTIPMSLVDGNIHYE
jgi:hypothetical protein